MKSRHWITPVVIVAVCLSAVGLAGIAAGEAVRPTIYSPHAANFSCQMNMGPTGATAWMRGYDFVVTSIQEGSPAHGRLELGDVVTSADGTAFGEDADPRITLGNALERAEATRQPLRLTVRRAGKSMDVELPLPELGAFAPTWPAGCEKSKRILDGACRSLLDAQLPNGEVVTDGSMGTFLTGLLLLASGDAQYLDGARRAAYRAASLDYTKIDYSNWPMGYGGLLLSEYYLATGDDSVLEKLGWIADALAKGQMNCGSWGHNSPGGGYGALNQAGLVDAIALVLAAECGVDVDRAAMNKALAFFGRYAELGSVPYGDHGPGGGPDDNGHNASAAILMHLAGRDDLAAAFSRSVAMSYWMREDGHTGAFFSLTWGPLGAALAGPQAFRTFMDYQRWFYNLCVTWQGDLVHIPYQEALTRFDDSSYIYFGGEFTTGGMGLVFALPRHRLRILGAPQSVFDVRSKLDPPLREARRLYLARDWSACDQAIAAIEPEKLSGREQRRWFAQLKDARALNRAATDRTLLEIGSNLENGAPYRASEQYLALKRCLGENGDERFPALDERFAGGTMEWYLREGTQYYEAWRGMKVFAVKSWVPQGLQAKRLLEGLPTLRLPLWEPLSPTSDITPQAWRTLLLDPDGTPPEGWEKPGFDDSGWMAGEGVFCAAEAKDGKRYPSGGIVARRVFSVEDPEGAALRVRMQTVRPAKTRVYLNGVLVVDAVRGQRGGYAAIKLDDAALKLLRPEGNVLAVTSTRQGGGANRLDVGLEIARTRGGRRTLPVLRAEKPFLPEPPDGGDVLRVKETRDRMQQELQASFDRKSIPDLLKDLHDPVAYRRGLAENALVAKGAEGLAAAAGLADDADWKARSAFCDVVARGWRKYQPEAESKEMERLVAQVPALTKLLKDEHFWVRDRAASTLSGMGEAAEPAVPALLQRAGDPNEWVRIAAIRAVQRLVQDPKAAVAAAIESLEKPSTAYGAPRTAVALLEKYEGSDTTRLDALLNLLRHPPQGGGRGVLNRAMDQAAALDPGGARLVPVLIAAAADSRNYGRQRGDPRGKAIELLGSYGPKAKAAVPTLKAILASEDATDKKQHEAAQKALDAIRGTEAPGA